MIDPMIQVFAKVWIRLYKLKPILTSVSTVMIIIIIAASITYIEKNDREKREAKRLESMDYHNQIQQLNQMESNVKQLLSFVDTQKQNLKETEDTLLKLKWEKEKLQPIVESNQAIIEALFSAQEERISTNVWRERWIGFGFGILASLIASFLWFVISMIASNAADAKSSEAD